MPGPNEPVEYKSWGTGGGLSYTVGDGSGACTESILLYSTVKKYRDKARDERCSFKVEA